MTALVGKWGLHFISIVSIASHLYCKAGKTLYVCMCVCIRGRVNAGFCIFHAEKGKIKRKINILLRLKKKTDLKLFLL